MHAYLTRFVVSGDPTFQHIAIWTLLQLLESGDKKLMECIAKATDIVEAIKTISEREIPADAEETGDEEGEAEVVALARRCLEVLAEGGKRGLVEG